ncbi:MULTISPECIES: lipoyl synthase [Acidithiobacillus]|jgi:lipoic acid synthetase|uniref:Lipoyl synthase n=5 Tax=Acidithiobacillus caldus TaxID=33059 RepID=F9ZRI9_ACICS|nr:MULTISPECIES: lipoyl synthase [Acidithiobacillus]AEK59027.1 Lipoate synthase [Acidithiobacillus caldus SM-1]AIA56076.1 Lipoate synthase [Acidithiobacillus caldus ATCC 51756]AUW33425.1 lipoyl synthase [Acidithiobacillus caldus]MBU2730639.1 lipoyl synthase [Acidithiobacillus caldus]MBU2736231.1 lipoyl synthase [Acidithiobacillus caldus ATCC 51756]
MSAAHDADGTGRAQRGRDKVARNPIPIVAESVPRQRKPDWFRVTSPLSPEVDRLKGILRDAKLHTVCEEASCPNLGECFGSGTATFMILGDLCTRRCPFCDVAHGRPEAPDPEEPEHLAETVARMGLRFVVVTSVDRDDLRDGGAAHFAAVIGALRARCPQLHIEILVPDFRGRAAVALDILGATPPDVFNHNLETVPRLYPRARPGADYRHSLQLLRDFKARQPQVPSKSGLMLGLGESLDEIRAVLQDLRAANCDLLTLGQYLAPSRHHLPVERYVPPEEFAALRNEALAMGFSQVAAGPLVRSSYHAEHSFREWRADE